MFRNLASLVLLCVTLPVSAQSGASNTIEEIVVQASSILAGGAAEGGSFSAIDEETIAGIGARHINETLARIPGVWVSRGSGQEHLTAIRSPVFTGAGACGEFSYLENGIPIRPAGFCNINNLFEVFGEQAETIEVWRGPAGAALGGNAVHGAVNVITRAPDGLRLEVEGGPYDFYRVQLSGGRDIGDQKVGFAFLQAGSNGFRDDTGYGQQKLSLHHETAFNGWEVANRLTATLLNQETGAFVQGFEAYDDGDLRDTNPSPEAFRDAWSIRASSRLAKDAWTITPYLRRSDMRFLQHFLPGQPLEENAQTSGGLIATHEFDLPTLDLVAGAHIEYMDGELREFQAGPTVGSAFLVETRPPGLHYDYDVKSWMAAAFYDLGADLTERTRLVHSLRVEHLAYDYGNNHIVGNTRDDGSVCGFGGCLYTRPASRDDDFTNVAARLGVETRLDSGLFYAAVSSGFRPPQATELYRLRGGQTVADLDSEEILSVEVGFRAAGWSVAAFREETRNLLLRDADAFNISDGETESLGVELEGSWTWGAHTLELATSYARHEYGFDRAADGRETIEDGNEIDTAPRWLGNLRWRMEIGASFSHELELVIVGEHEVNAANTASYGGHEVLNWRGRWQLDERLQLFARIINVTDERYADRADFAFGSYRYFPAMPRQLYLGMRYDL